jgi:general secretion pathway protein L
MARAGATWDRLVWGWADLRRLLGVKGFWPQVVMLASTHQGARWRIVGDRRAPADGGVPEALLVDSADVLWGEIRLPAMATRALDAAVAEALWRVSPLPPDQVVSAWRAEPDENGGWRIEWGICPSRVVDQGLAQLDLPVGAPVYLPRGDAGALPMQGPAKLATRQRQRRLDALAGAGLAVVAIALAVPAVMPLVLKRNAVVRGMSHLAAVEPMATPLRQKLDELHQLSKLSEALAVDREHSLPVASVVERLAEVLPSDVWLDRLEASDRQVRMMGLAPDATELMTRLSKVPEFAELRTTAPTVRDEGQNRERFSFEFAWRDASAAVAAK